MGLTGGIVSRTCVPRDRPGAGPVSQTPYRGCSCVPWAARGRSSGSAKALQSDHGSATASRVERPRSRLVCVWRSGRRVGSPWVGGTRPRGTGRIHDRRGGAGDARDLSGPRPRALVRLFLLSAILSEWTCDSAATPP